MQDLACLAKMEQLLRQFELDFKRMEEQRVTVPMWELHGMLQRRPMWQEIKRDCINEKQ
jgi:hypothetical protein